jgi:hypothetical protein
VNKWIGQVVDDGVWLYARLGRVGRRGCQYRPWLSIGHRRLVCDGVERDVGLEGQEWVEGRWWVGERRPSEKRRL